MTKGASHSKTGLQPIGERVRRIRTERNLSQDRVALSANIDQSGFSKFERGVRSLGEDSLRRVAAVLGVEFELMVRDTDFGLQPGQEGRPSQ
jgi:transcriptional regulator with XRE-family HTH domain